MERQWTEFQRSCVEHIAGLLHSIRGLVATLGDDALENYCHHGCLGSVCVERVKTAAFIQPEDERPEDEEDEDGLEDVNEGSQDGARDSEDEE